MGKSLFYLAACILGAVIVLFAHKRIFGKALGAKAAVLPLVIIPFLSGGFYAYLAPVISIGLFLLLLSDCRRRGRFVFYFNETLLALAALLISGLLSVLWAADRGMSVYGAVKALPLLMYALLLMQSEGEEREEAYRVLPLCGAVMTVMCVLFSFIPALESFVTVNHRISGFFEYPNVYAVFLLVCLTASGLRPERRFSDTVIDALLVVGVFASGSRTVFLMMLVLLPAIVIMRRELKYLPHMLAILAVGFALSFALGAIDSTASATRYLTTSTSASTFLGRLLYYKDALPVIAQNPLGIGYWGYLETQGSFQTGLYTISFVHNELLQMLLDYGWIPSALVCFALIRSFFSKSAGRTERTIMLVILAHSMLDFDLQFTEMWLLLLLVMDVRRGKRRSAKKVRALPVAAAAVLLLFSGWLGAAEAMYRFGATDTCLAIAPFHTLALEQSLTEAETAQDMKSIANRILELNENSTLAHSALANVRFSEGDIKRMMSEKELAIAYDRYTIDEYCDYIGKLYTAMQLYISAGDESSAQVCREKILAVPDMLKQLEEETDALAWKITDKPQFELPDDYQMLIAELSGQ